MVEKTTEIKPLETRDILGRLDPAMCLQVLADADLQKGFVQKESNVGSAYLCNIEYLVEEGIFKLAGHQKMPDSETDLYTYCLTEKGRTLYNGLCGMLAGIVGLPGDDCRKINQL